MKSDSVGPKGPAVTALIAFSSAAGIFTLIAPFFFPGIGPVSSVLLSALVLLILAAFFSRGGLMAEAQTKFLSLLAVLSALNAVLRLIPMPAGFSAAFLLPILCGFSYGPVFGFVLGNFSLFLSGVLSGGIGPWLPFQMLGLGWVGLVAGWLPRHRPGVVLPLYGALAGYAFGLVTNLWFWPYLSAPSPDVTSFSTGLSFSEQLGRYSAFYAITSLWWDSARAAGNVVLIAALGPTILNILNRFRRRFFFEAEGLDFPPGSC